LQIYHHNIQSIKWKSDDILDFFYTIFHHVVCITEHHLNHYEIVQFHIGNYTPGANYCRHSLKKGGVCVFVHNNLGIVGNDLKKISNQDIEACAIRLLYNSYNICILTIYRAPTGNFTCFIKKLEAILCSLCTLNMQFIKCGDISV
jgi:exonuclease III